MITYYTILSVKENASFAEIESSYKKKAFEYHPDFNKEVHDKQMFEAIQKAFDTLSDSEKRKEYDNKLMMFRNEITPQHQEETTLIVKEKQDNPNILNVKNKWAFLGKKEWIFIYIVFALKVFLQIGIDNPLTFRDFMLSLAECLGYTFGAFLPAFFIAVIGRILSGKYVSSKTFAYMVLGVLIVSLINSI